MLAPAVLPWKTSELAASSVLTLRIAKDVTVVGSVSQPPAPDPNTVRPTGWSTWRNSADITGSGGERPTDAVRKRNEFNHRNPTVLP